MDGKGRYVESASVERLRRSVKYEDVYPRVDEMLAALHAGLISTTPGTVTADWTDAPRVRCTLNRQPQDWLPEIQRRFQLRGCRISRVHF